jgi:LysR family transcriptional regulator, glycine cleavage system transcriptional activator
MRNAPSMTGLRVLEAVVRTGSLSAAARELCVTPAAVSHRLRDLERQGGAALVLRVNGRFVATEVGQTVLHALGDAFTRIRAADAILSDQRPLSLRIVSSYSFAVLWLAPRLSRFQERHPEVRLFLDPSHSPLDQTAADIIILHAAQPPEKHGWTLLFADRCAALARPGHPVFQQPGTGPDAVLHCKLVHVSHGKGRIWGEFSWQDWANALGVPGVVPATGPTVTAEHLAVDLVLAEDVLALVSRVNASRLTSDGRLRAVPDTTVASGCSYWTALKGNIKGGGGVAEDFLAWMHAELADERHLLC